MSRFRPPPPPFCYPDKDMQAELARHHQHQPQRSNMNPNHYLNVSIPYSSNPSNYNLLSDPNNGNTIGPQSTEIIDVYGSDSASVSSCSVPSSAASSFVHLPLANTAVDDISTRKESFGGGYDNVSLPFLVFASDVNICGNYCAYIRCFFFLWGHPNDMDDSSTTEIFF